MDVAYRSAGVLPSNQPSLDLRRYLVVANQTLVDPMLVELVGNRCSAAPSRLHVIVPHQRRLLPFVDPVLGVPMDAGLEGVFADQHELEAANQRLDWFISQFAGQGNTVSGEVVSGDPITAARGVRRAMGFDEIIVSTLPAGLSAWLRLDLPTRLARAFDLPVVTLTQPG